MSADIEGRIVKKVFLDVTIYCYEVVGADNIIKKKPVAFLMIETNDPDTRIFPLGYIPAGSWTHLVAETQMKDQRNLE